MRRSYLIVPVSLLLLVLFGVGLTPLLAHEESHEAGEMLLTGDRYEISGLSIPVPVSRRIFVTAEVGFGFTLLLACVMPLV